MMKVYIVRRDSNHISILVWRSYYKKAVSFSTREVSQCEWCYFEDFFLHPIHTELDCLVVGVLISNAIIMRATGVKIMLPSVALGPRTRFLTIIKYFLSSE